MIEPHCSLFKPKFTNQINVKYQSFFGSGLNQRGWYATMAGHSHHSSILSLRDGSFTEGHTNNTRHMFLRPKHVHGNTQHVPTVLHLLEAFLEN